MIEEAAGTRLYECKKQVAQKTIEKKDARLKEINDVSHPRYTSRKIPKLRTDTFDTRNKRKL